MVVRDSHKTEAFAFQTVKKVDVRLEFKGQAPAADSGALSAKDSGNVSIEKNLVQIRESDSGRVVFKAAVPRNGEVSGQLGVATTVKALDLEFAAQGSSYTMPVAAKDLAGIDRTITMLSQQSATDPIPDRDGDGVPDVNDDFPEDHSRATAINYPSNGGDYTIAYEDLYPVQGDSDFNDYVVQAQIREELNGEGEIVRVQASIRHVARAAGYKHILKWNLNSGPADFLRRQHGVDGELKKETAMRVESGEGLQISERSDRTISQSNAHRGQKFIPGDSFQIEVAPDKPVSRSALGVPPFDLYLYVLNTRREIHFAGRFFDDSGKDLYRDEQGFPWALLVPVDWRWMYETEDIHDAYGFFRAWYMSLGNFRRDWYLFVDDDYVAGVPPGQDLMDEIQQICPDECGPVENEQHPPYQLTTEDVEYMAEAETRLSATADSKTVLDVLIDDYERVFRGEHPTITPALVEASILEDLRQVRGIAKHKRTYELKRLEKTLLGRIVELRLIKQRTNRTIPENYLDAELMALTHYRRAVIDELLQRGQN